MTIIHTEHWVCSLRETWFFRSEFLGHLSITPSSREKRYQALPAFPYRKWWKAGRGLGTRLWPSQYSSFSKVHKSELSNAVLLLAKPLLKNESESWGHGQKSHTLHKSPPLPYPASSQLDQIKAWVRLDQAVLQYTHEEWSSIASPGLAILGLSSLTSRQEVDWY